MKVTVPLLRKAENAGAAIFRPGERLQVIVGGRIYPQAKVPKGNIGIAWPNGTWYIAKATPEAIKVTLKENPHVPL